MDAVFVELGPFRRHRSGYLDDDAYRSLQQFLMVRPEAGVRMPGTGGLRKLRFADERRGKGKRGGLRVIYTGGTEVVSFGCSCFTIKTKRVT